MKKDTPSIATDILDIHTHNLPGSKNAINNYPLLGISPLYLPPVSNPIEGMMRDIMLQKMMTRPPTDPTILNFLPLNESRFSKGCYYSVGIHPWEITEVNVFNQLLHFQHISKRKKVVAIGEAGLDKLAGADMDIQLAVFKLQVLEAELVKKPLIIHCVKAVDELLFIRKDTLSKQPWIWHGFRGKPKQAEQLLKQGFYLSFGQFYHEETLAMVPANRLFLETDNAGIDIEVLLQKAATLRGVETDVLRTAIRENVEKVFFKG